MSAVNHRKISTENHGRSEILVAVTINITLNLYVTPYTLLNLYIKILEQYAASIFRREVQAHKFKYTAA
jgi:hypothetical protein